MGNDWTELQPTKLQENCNKEKVYNDQFKSGFECIVTLFAFIYEL